MAVSNRVWLNWMKQNHRKLDQFLKYSSAREVNRTLRRCLSTFQQPKYDFKTNLICDGIIRSPFPDIIPLHTTIDELIWSNLDRWPNHTAIECATTGRKYTYNQLRILTKRFATSLRKHFNPGDILSIMLPNIPDYPIILLGALEAGMVISPINPICTSYELSHVLDDNRAVALVTLPEFLTKVNDAKQEIESKTNTAFPLRSILVNYSSESLPANAINYFDLISDNVCITDIKCTRKPDDIAILPYSSGTTGLPKGVELVHRNIVSNILQASDPRIGIIMSTIGDHQEVLPAVLPFYHIYGLVLILFRGIMNGSKLVTLSKFEANSFISLLSDHRATVLFAVPPIITLLGNHGRVHPEHFTSLKCICNGAGPIAVSDKDKLYTKAKSHGNFHFIQGYGLTETSPLALISPVYLKDFTSMVPISSTVMKVIKEDGTLAGPKEPGEICIRGPQVMRAYHKRESATKETIDEKGYLHTGDGGYYQEDGTLRIIERLKELIKVQGFQVAPAELEAILRSHPQVSDAAVIGIPDTRTGEKPLAFVVRNGNMSEQELQNYVASKVSPYKKLAAIIFTNSIPKSPAGKILRRILKDEYNKSQK